MDEKNLRNIKVERRTTLTSIKFIYTNFIFFKFIFKCDLKNTNLILVKF